PRRLLDGSAPFVSAWNRFPFGGRRATLCTGESGHDRRRGRRRHRGGCMSTIADVAARAGVSKATASRALSGRGYVSEDTRARVQRAADALSYVAHSSATSLATGRTQTVGMIVPAVGRWFFSELISGAQEALLENG